MNQQPSLRQCFATSLWRATITAPAPSVFALSSSNRNEFLTAVLRDAVQLAPAATDDFDPSTIEIQLRRIDQRPTVILQLPPPFRCPDPHLVALVLDKRIASDVRKSDLEGACVSYFALEEPPEGHDRAPTMLCSRSPDGTHHNHGAGPAPDIDAFCDRLKRLYNPAPWWRFW